MHCVGADLKMKIEKKTKGHFAVNILGHCNNSFAPVVLWSGEPLETVETHN